MALRSEGFRVSTTPRAPRNIDMSDLILREARSIGSGLAGGAELIGQYVGEAKQKERQDKIEIAALEHMQGNEDLLQDLPEGDRADAVTLSNQLQKQKIDLDNAIFQSNLNKMNQQIDSLASRIGWDGDDILTPEGFNDFPQDVRNKALAQADKRRLEQIQLGAATQKAVQDLEESRVDIETKRGNIQKSEREQAIEDLSYQIQFTEDGVQFPQVPDDMDEPAAMQALAMAKSRDIENQTKLNDLSASERKAQESASDNAFVKITNGSADLEDYQGRPFFDQLQYRIRMQDPEERFSTHEIDGTQIIVDNANASVASVDKPTEVEKLMQVAAGGDPDLEEQYARWYIEDRVKKNQTVKVGDMSFELDQRQNAVYENINQSMLQGEGKITSNSMIREKNLPTARATILSMIKNSSTEDVEQTLGLLSKQMPPEDLVETIKDLAELERFPPGGKVGALRTLITRRDEDDVVKDARDRLGKKLTNRILAALEEQDNG